MASKRVWNTINLSLTLIAVILTLSLFNVKIPGLGEVFYLLDKEEPLLIVNWQENYEACPDLSRCCLIILPEDCRRDEQQFSEGRTSWACGSGREDTLRYYLNSKAYSYCQQMPWS